MFSLSITASLLSNNVNTGTLNVTTITILDNEGNCFFRDSNYIWYLANSTICMRAVKLLQASEDCHHNTKLMIIYVCILISKIELTLNVIVSSCLCRLFD